MVRRLSLAAVLVALLAGCGGDDEPDGTVGAAPGSFEQVQEIADVRCVPCHSPNPTIEGYEDANLIDFTNPDNLEANKEAIYQLVVVEKRMPFQNNATGMTQEERDEFAAWAKPD
jgi:uncharacterized membrane protein